MIQGISPVCVQRKDTDVAPSEYLFAEEMESDYKLPASTWRYFYSVGKGPKASKLGRRLVWKRSDVEAWMAEQEESPSGATA
jgi:predicted DNA-binding transcriptional regulator AlpA